MLERRRIFETCQALADLNALDAGHRGDVAARYFLGFVAFQAAKRVELGEASGHDFAGELGDAHVGAAAQRTVEDASDGDTPEKIAVVEVHHLRLQDARGIAGRLGNRRQNGFKQGLEILRAIVQFAVRDAFFRVGVEHGKI